MSYDDALHRYFLLKQEHDESLRMSHRNLFQSLQLLSTSSNNGESSMIEENDELLHKKRSIHRQTYREYVASHGLPKAPCVQCRRPVGTLFGIDNDRYTAVCGDTTSPCTLRIELYRSRHSKLTDLVDGHRAAAEELQEKIIQQKLDSVFEYVSPTEAIESFKRMRGEYLQSINDLSEIEAKYITLMHDADHTDMLASRKADLSRLQYTIRDMLDTATAPTPDTIRLAVNIQSEDMAHLANRIQQMNYDVQEIIDVYPQRLVQYNVDPAKLEIPYLEEPKVIHFVFQNKTSFLDGEENKLDSRKSSESTSGYESDEEMEPEQEQEEEPETEPIEESEEKENSIRSNEFDADYLTIANNDDDDDTDINSTSKRNSNSNANADTVETPSKNTDDDNNEIDNGTNNDNSISP